MGGARDTVKACAQGQGVRAGRRSHTASGSDTVFLTGLRCGPAVLSQAHLDINEILLLPFSPEKKQNKTVFKHF